MTVQQPPPTSPVMKGLILNPLTCSPARVYPVAWHTLMPLTSFMMYRFTRPARLGSEATLTLHPPSMGKGSCLM